MRALACNSRESRYMSLRRVSVWEMRIGMTGRLRIWRRSRVDTGDNTPQEWEGRIQLNKQNQKERISMRVLSCRSREHMDVERASFCEKRSGRSKRSLTIWCCIAIIHLNHESAHSYEWCHVWMRGCVICICNSRMFDTSDSCVTHVTHVWYTRHVCDAYEWNQIWMRRCVVWICDSHMCDIYGSCDHHAVTWPMWPFLIHIGVMPHRIQTWEMPHIHTHKDTDR